MKVKKIIYWGSTGLVSMLLLFSAGMYVLSHEEVAGSFTALGFPTFVIYPLAVAKILGVFAIVLRKSEVLTEWVYAGFTFNLLLAVGAHLSVSDGGFVPALMALVFIITSYLTGKSVRNQTL